MNENILNQLKSAKTEKEREWLTMQFTMESLSSEVREAIWAAAIPHFFDAKMLNTLLGKELALKHFNSLIKLSFIETYLDFGYSMHERTRSVILTKLWNDDRKLYHEYNQKAADYCKKQKKTDFVWETEEIYHSLLAGEDSSVFSSQCIKWHNSPNFFYDKVEILASFVIEEIEAGRISGDVAAWAYLFMGVIQVQYSRSNDAKRNLEVALRQSIADQALKANCFKALGDVHIKLSEYEQARARYDQALPIYNQIGAPLGEANCIKALGDVYIKLDEYEIACARYEEALSIYNQIGDRLGEANSIKALGDVHIRLSEYEKSRTRYEQATPIYNEIGDCLGEANCIKAIGDVHLELSEYDQARARYEQALPIYSQIGNRLEEAECIKGFGDIFKGLAEFDEAIKSYKEAMCIFDFIGARHEKADVLSSLGDVYIELKQTETGNKYLEQATALFEEIGSPRAGKIKEKLIQV